VITADDFGLAEEVNDAVALAHRNGILSAASLMVAGPAAAHAVALARRMPGLRVGLHLVLVDGAPVLAPQQIPDLVDSSGRLRSDMVSLAFDLALRPSARRQLREEIAAQFTAFDRTRLALDHVNAHKHFHLHPIVAGEVIAVGRQHALAALRVPREPAAVIRRLDGARGPHAPDALALWAALLHGRARRAGLLIPDAVFGLRWSGRLTADRLVGLLRQLPEGLIEIYTHPATAGTFAGHAPGYRYADELAALLDADVMDALRRSGRRPCGYSDLALSVDAGRISAASSLPRETKEERP
jgi:hopanoid biosynthesis associated protein HpnK